MRACVCILVLLCPCLGWAGYTSQGTVTFPGATGSTQTKITLAFSFSDAKFKTVANGGQITSTSTRVGLTVPNDVIFTDDSTCATATGSYTWGYEDYGPTTGIGHGWILIPSHTTSPHVPVVCVGNAAVVTYQGGSAGAEFDAATVAVYHMPDGTTLSAKDFSASANNGAITTVSAGVGEIGGGGAATSGKIQVPNATSLNLGTTLTLEGWFKTSSTGAYQSIVAKGISSGAGRRYGLILGPSGTTDIFFAFVSTNNPGDVTISQAWTTGAWHHLVGTSAAGVWVIYLDGVSVASGTQAGSATVESAVLQVFNDPGGGAVAFNGSLDEVRVISSSRSANWIATEFANQSSPPSISALVAVQSNSSQSLIF